MLCACVVFVGVESEMKKFLRNLLDYSVYAFVRVFVCAVQCVPLDACRRISEFLAFLFCDVLRIRGKLVEENLKYAFPEKSRTERKTLERRMWLHLFLMVAEVAHAQRELNPLNWFRHVTIENGRELFTALQEDRPIILITDERGRLSLIKTPVTRIFLTFWAIMGSWRFWRISPQGVRAPGLSSSVVLLRLTRQWL